MSTTISVQEPRLAAGDRSPTTGGFTVTRRHRLGVAALLAAVTLAAHGWTLFDGLALDDHWHYRTIQDGDWSMATLLDATTIDTETLWHTWWQEKPVRFQYARPVSVALMKVVYAVTGGSVVAQHVLNLFLHFVSALLVYQLCLLLTRHRLWAAAGGVLFALYPSSVFAVGWLAAQNMLLQTALLLGAVLLYIRASGLDVYIASPASPVGGVEAAPPMHRGALLGVVVLWVAGLFSRENAIMLPAIAVMLDLAFGGWRWVRSRWSAYLAFAVIGLAFLYWRLVVFHYPMPEVYVRRPGGDGYLLWCAAKLLHYLCCSVWPAPMAIGPSGRFEPFSEAPADMAVMAAIVVGVGVIYLLAARRARGWWIWPLWILLAVLPVVPVLATPHSGYLAGVGASVGVILGPAVRHWRVSRPLGYWPAGVAGVVLLVSIAFMKCNRLMWMGMVYAERFTTASLDGDPPGDAVTEVFCINLPFANIYAPWCGEEAEAGAPRKSAARWHVLSFAPELTRMNERSILTRVDDHRFTVEIQGRPYFSGLLGRFLIHGYRNEGRFAAGQRFETEHFAVEVLEAGEEGVTRLGYTFREPLNSAHYCFYLSSFDCGALKIRFDQLDPREGPARPLAGTLPAPPASVAELRAAIDRVLAGDPHAIDAVFAGLDATEEKVRRGTAKALRDLVRTVAVATADPAQAYFGADQALPEQVGELRRWWYANVDTELLKDVFRDWEIRYEIRDRRDEIVRARALIGRLIRTDLYLTGRPFPGPR